MCTDIVETAEISGSGKGAEGWFSLGQANVYYDHPFHAPLDHALIIDFVQEPNTPGHRVAVELTYDSAVRLMEAIRGALASGIDAHASDLRFEPELIAVR
jgi:hypothetical protein